MIKGGVWRNTEVRVYMASCFSMMLTTEWIRVRVSMKLPTHLTGFSPLRKKKIMCAAASDRRKSLNTAYLVGKDDYIIGNNYCSLQDLENVSKWANIRAK